MLIALDAEAYKHGKSHLTYMLKSKQFVRLVKKKEASSIM